MGVHLSRPQQQGMRREAGAEGSQHHPVPGAQAVVHDFIEAEEDRRRGHIAVAGQNLPGGEELFRGDLEFLSHGGQDLVAAPVQGPVGHVRHRQAPGRQDVLHGLGHRPVDDGGQVAGQLVI